MIQARRYQAREVLEGLPFWDSLNNVEKSIFLSSSIIRKVNRGEFVFYASDPAAYAWLMLSGSGVLDMDLENSRIDGSAASGVAVLPGDIPHGESIYSNEYSSSVATLQDSYFLRIQKEVLIDSVNSEVLAWFTKSCIRLRERAARIAHDKVSVSTVCAICRFIREYCIANDTDLFGLNQSSTAAVTWCTRVTVNKVFRPLKKMGVLTREGMKYRVNAEKINDVIERRYF